MESLSLCIDTLKVGYKISAFLRKDAGELTLMCLVRGKWLMTFVTCKVRLDKFVFYIWDLWVHMCLFPFLVLSFFPPSYAFRFRVVTIENGHCLISCGFCYVVWNLLHWYKKSFYSLEESMPVEIYICDTFPVFTFSHENVGFDGLKCI